MAETPNTAFRCLVCNGTGLVSKRPGIAGDVMTWTDCQTGPYRCNTCGGFGMVFVRSAAPSTPESGADG